MFEFLRCHPFSVVAHFKNVIALTYAAPAEQLAPLLPPALELDAYEGRGFVAVAMVETEDLRPANFPRGLGMNFVLAGYRIFSRFRTDDGRNLRGLYILRSSTDRRLMEFGGNLFTDYRYRRCGMTLTRSNQALDISVVSPGGDADLTLTADLSPTDPLPPGPVFSDARTARRFAGPLPYTFSYVAASRTVRVVEGFRENWTPRPIHVSVSRNTYVLPNGVRLESLPLASAFHVADIDYRWSRGVLTQPAEVCSGAELIPAI